MEYETPSRESVAFHEAGHAVIAYLTGYHIIDGPIDIDGSQSEGSHAIVPLLRDEALVAERRLQGWNLDQQQLVQHRCLIAVAGYTAEQVRAEKLALQFNSSQAFAGAHGDVLSVRELVGNGHFFELSTLLFPMMNEASVQQQSSAPFLSLPMKL